jgi:hypothetical protein
VLVNLLQDRRHAVFTHPLPLQKGGARLLDVKLYEPVSSECLKVAPRCAGKRAGRRSLIIATEALASSDNERGPEARVRNKYEFSRRISRASMEEDQRQADRIDLKVMARTHASAALKPRQLSPIVITNIVHRVSTSRRVANAVDGY